MNARVLWDIAPLALERSATRATPPWPSIDARGSISHRTLAFTPLPVQSGGCSLVVESLSVLKTF